MSISAEPEARPSARTRIANWLNKAFSLSVSENDPELIKKARAFGTDELGRRDAIVESWIRQAQEEEQRTREQRHDKEQHQIEQRRVERRQVEQWQIEQKIAQAIIDERNENFIRLWKECWDIAVHGTHEGDEEDVEKRNGLLAEIAEGIGEYMAEQKKELRDEIALIADANKKSQTRINALEEFIRAQQTQAQQRVEEMREHAQRLTGIENSLLETRSAVDDIKQQLTNTISKSINELEERHQQDEMRYSEQAKTFADLLTGAEQQIGDLGRQRRSMRERRCRALAH